VFDGRHAAAEHGHFGCCRDFASGCLITESAEYIDRRSDENNPRIGTGLGKDRILGQEAVAGMNRVNADPLCQSNDAVDVEVRLDRLASLADLIRLISFETMQSEPVFVCINRDGLYAKLVGGAKHSNRDFGTVGDKELANFHLFGTLRNRAGVSESRAKSLGAGTEPSSERGRNGQFRTVDQDSYESACGCESTQPESSRKPRCHLLALR
jgi:hypothetical protein